MFQPKLLSFVLAAAAAALAVHPAFAQEKLSSVKKAQALLSDQSGASLLAPAKDRPKPLPEKAAIAVKLHAQSLTQFPAIEQVGLGDLDKFSLPASGKNRAAIPGMTHANLTANRVDKPVELKSLSMPAVPASKLRGDVHPNPVPLP